MADGFFRRGDPRRPVVFEDFAGGAVDLEVCSAFALAAVRVVLVAVVVVVVRGGDEDGGGPLSCCTATRENTQSRSWLIT